LTVGLAISAKVPKPQVSDAKVCLPVPSDNSRRYQRLSAYQRDTFSSETLTHFIGQNGVPHRIEISQRVVSAALACPQRTYWYQ
jgi:hypothetical protein